MWYHQISDSSTCATKGICLPLLWVPSSIFLGVRDFCHLPTLRDRISSPELHHRVCPPDLVRQEFGMFVLQQMWKQAYTQVWMEPGNVQCQGRLFGGVKSERRNPYLVQECRHRHPSRGQRLQRRPTLERMICWETLTKWMKARKLKQKIFGRSR